MKNQSYLNDLDIIHLMHSQNEVTSLSLFGTSMYSGAVQSALNDHHAGLTKLAASIKQ